MYEKVTVIGLGTLGGYLCKNLSEQDSIRELVIVDYDIVESKNVFKSIYNFSDIGEYKANALYEMLKHDVTVTKMITEYVEGKTILPKSELIIDCRDVVCDRKDEIDVRLYISDKNLIIDCRKQVTNHCEYNGEYSTNLTSNEIKRASYFASQIIESGQIKSMMKNQLIQKINLNLLNTVVTRSIKKSIDNKVDIIYDVQDQPRKIYCIDENILPIMKLNSSSDINVFIGSRKNSSGKNRSPLSVIPKKTLNTSTDIITYLNDIIKTQPGVTNFILTVRYENGERFIELLEETGAA